MKRRWMKLEQEQEDEQEYLKFLMDFVIKLMAINKN